MSTPLPPGWVRAPLREVATGGVFADGDWVESKDQNPNGDVRLIQLADIGDGRFLDKSSRFLTSQKAAELRCTFLEQGDVLISRMADPIGRACIFPGAERQCVTVVDVCIVRPPTSAADRKWLVSAINSPQFRESIERAASGTTRSRVSRGNLGGLELPVPPLNEQRRIVAKLESIQARSRRAREALEAVPPLLEKLRQSILAAAFRGDLTKDWREKNRDVEPASVLLERIRAERRRKWEEGELAKMRAKGREPRDDGWRARYEDAARVDPKVVSALPILPHGWGWATLDELLEGSLYGPRFAAGDYVADGVPTIRTTDMDSSGRIQLRSPPEVRVTSAQLAELGCRDGDLLVTRTGSIGKCAVYEQEIGPALPSAYLIRFRLLSAIAKARFVFRQLQGPRLQALMGLGATATTQPNINARTLGALPFAVCSVSEQAVLVQRVEERLAAIESLERSIAGLTTRQDGLERAVLATAFRGELVPQDPDDESADAMLARLSALAGAGLVSAPGALKERKNSPKRTVAKRAARGE